MSTPSDSPIRLTGQEYVNLYLDPLLTQYNVSKTQVDIIYQPQSSSVRLVSREFSSEGAAGAYANSKTFSYSKQNLGSLYPYPVLYVGTYPLTYRVLIQLLREQYGWVIEDGEFNLRTYTDAGAATGSFTPTLDSVIELTPARNSGKIEFVARAQSLRWVQGSVLKLLVQPVEGRTRLEALYPLSLPLSMDSLRDNTDPVFNAPTLFNTTGTQAVFELIRRTYGFTPAQDQFDITYVPAGADLQVTLTARERDTSNAIGRYRNSFTARIMRADLSQCIPYPLNVDGTYSMSWTNFVAFMRNSFGMTVEAGEFHLGSDVFKTPLGPGSTIALQPSGRSQDTLVATATSKRWIPGTALTYRLVFRDQIAVFGQLADTVEETAIAYQYNVQGGTGPYTVSNITGLPPGFTLSNTGLLTGTASVGTYDIYAQFTDQAGNVGYLIDTFTFTARVYDPVSITGGTLPTGRLGEAYQQYAAVTGGKLPYSNLRVTSGRLPAGVEAIIQGAQIRFAGIPTEGFSGSAVVALDSADGQTDDALFTFQIDAYDQLAFGTDAVGPAYVGQPYSQHFSVTGGRLPYSNPRLVSGTVPEQTTFRISGTEVIMDAYPTTVGTYTGQLAVSSTDGQTAVREVTVNVTLQSQFEWDQVWHQTDRGYSADLRTGEVHDLLWVDRWQKWVSAETTATNPTQQQGLFIGPHPTFMERYHPEVALDLRAFQEGATLTYAPEIDTLVVFGYFNQGAIVGEAGPWQAATGDRLDLFASPVWVPFLQKFVVYARGSNHVAYSSNGVSWTTHQIAVFEDGDTGSFNGLYVDPRRQQVVVIARDGKVWVSDDLLNWVQTGTHPLSGNQGNNVIRWSEALGAPVALMFQGFTVNGTVNSPGVYVSYNRTTWTLLPGLNGFVTDMIDFPQYGEMWFTFEGQVRRYRAGVVSTSTPAIGNTIAYLGWSTQQQRVMLLARNGYWTTDIPPAKPRNLDWDSTWTPYDRGKYVGGDSVYVYDLGYIEPWDTWLFADYSNSVGDIFKLGPATGAFANYPGIDQYDWRASGTQSAFAYSPELDVAVLNNYGGLQAITNPATPSISPLVSLPTRGGLMWVPELACFMAFDFQGTDRYWRSGDGKTWTVHSSGFAGTGTVGFAAWAYHPQLEMLVWMRADGNIYGSANGIDNWVLVGTHPFADIYNTRGGALRWSKVLNRMVYTRFQGTDPGLYVSEMLESWTRLQILDGFQFTDWDEAPGYGELVALSGGKAYRYSYGVWSLAWALPALSEASVAWSQKQERFMLYSAGGKQQGLYLSRPDPEVYSGSGWSTDAADRFGTGVTLSHGNNVVEYAGTDANGFLQRATRGNRDQVRYFEVVVRKINQESASVWVGVMDPSEALTAAAVTAYGSPSVAYRNDGRFFSAAEIQGDGFRTSWDDGVTVGVLVSFATGKVNFLNLPMPAYEHPGLAQASLVPFVASTGQGCQFTLRTRADQFKFAVPAGAVAWDEGIESTQPNYRIVNQTATVSNGALSLTTLPEIEWVNSNLTGQDGNLVVVTTTDLGVRTTAAFANGAYLRTADSAGFGYGNGDFTLTGTFVVHDFVATFGTLIANCASTTFTGGAGYLYISGDDTTFGQPRRLTFARTSYTRPMMQSELVLLVEQEYTFMLSRAGTTLSLTINNTPQASMTVDDSFTFGQGGTMLGANLWDGANSGFRGTLSQLRTVRGVGLEQFFNPRTMSVNVNRTAYEDPMVPTKDWDGGMWVDGGDDTWDGGQLVTLYPAGDVKGTRGVAVDVRGGNVTGAYHTQDITLAPGESVRVQSGWATPNVFVVVANGIGATRFSLGSNLMLGSDAATSQVVYHNIANAMYQGNTLYFKTLHSDDSNPLNPAAGDPAISYCLIPGEPYRSMIDTVANAYKRNGVIDQAGNVVSGKDPTIITTTESFMFTLVVAWGRASILTREQWLRAGVRIANRPTLAAPSVPQPLAGQVTIEWSEQPTWTDPFTPVKDMTDGRGWSDGGNDAFDPNASTDGLAMAYVQGQPTGVVIPLSGTQPKQVFTNLSVPFIGINQALFSKSGWLSDQVWASEVMAATSGAQAFSQYVRQSVGSDNSTQMLIRRRMVTFPQGQMTVKFLHSADRVEKLGLSPPTDGDPMITWLLVPRGSALALSNEDHWMLDSNTEGADNTVFAAPNSDPVRMRTVDNVFGYTLIMTWGYSDYLTRENALLRILRLNGRAPNPSILNFYNTLQIHNLQDVGNWGEWIVQGTASASSYRALSGYRSGWFRGDGGWYRNRAEFFNLNGRKWTISAHINPSSLALNNVPQNRVIVSSRNTADTLGIGFRINANGALEAYTGDKSDLMVSNTTLPMNATSHVALTFDPIAGRWYLAQNGVIVASAPKAANYDFDTNAGTYVAVGMHFNGTGYSESFYGQMARLEISFGEALYTAGYVVPTLPAPQTEYPSDPYADMVNTRLTFESIRNNCVVDESGLLGWSPIGQAVITNSLPAPLSGSRSGYFPTVDGAFRCNTYGLYDIGTENFTMEMLIRPTDTGVYGNLFNNRNDGVGNRGMCFRVDTSLILEFFWGAGYDRIASPNPIPMTRTTHVAVSREGNRLYLGVDGAIVASTLMNSSNSFSEGASPVSYIGAYGAIGQSTEVFRGGYVDWFVFTRGVARYKNTYAIPAYPAPISQA